MNPNKTKAPEMDLLTLAAETLKQTTGIACTIKPGNKTIDARLVLEFPDHKKTEFDVEINRNPTAIAAHHITAIPNRYLFVTDYVNPMLAERLRNLGVQFMDCTGNAYINTGATFLYVKGNKPEKELRVHQARLFNPGGLQVVFALLCNPELVRAPYREIAAKAEVALGTVAWVIKDMLTQGYVIDVGNKIHRLAKKDALLRMWLVGYEQILRPRQLVNRFHAEKHDWWMNANPGQGLWGGEVAAFKMTGHLKPETITLYATKLPEKLVFENKLRPDPKGEVEIVEPFWNFEYPEKKENLVPPLCVYADLLIRADGRTTETAKMVYERYLARHLTEN